MRRSQASPRIITERRCSFPLTRRGTRCDWAPLYAELNGRQIGLRAAAKARPQELVIVPGASMSAGRAPPFEPHQVSPQPSVRRRLVRGTHEIPLRAATFRS